MHTCTHTHRRACPHSLNAYLHTHVYKYIHTRIHAGAAVVTALTGVNLYAASFLIPLSVVFYTAQGGIMAAFCSSWGHVGIIYIAMLIFVWKVYTGPSDLGSTDKVMYESCP